MTEEREAYLMSNLQYWQECAEGNARVIEKLKADIAQIAKEKDKVVDFCKDFLIQCKKDHSSTSFEDIQRCGCPICLLAECDDLKSQVYRLVNNKDTEGDHMTHVDDQLLKALADKSALERRVEELAKTLNSIMNACTFALAVDDE